MGTHFLHVSKLIKSIDLYSPIKDNMKSDNR